MVSFLKFSRHNEHAIMLVLAVFVGLMVGYGAIFFRILIEFFQLLFMTSGRDHVTELVKSLPWYHVLLMPLLGGAIVGPMVHFFFPGSRGHGVPEVMSAVALHGGRIPFRDGMGKMLACSMSIGCGGSVGREGPVVHLGATLASWFSGQLKMSGKYRRTMVGCGAAAGIAATFNAPIAGVMFAMEVILNDYKLASFSPIVLASVIATVISRMYLGDAPAFIIPHYSLVSVWEIPAYVGLGLGCGLVGILFMYSLFKTEDLIAKIPIPLYVKPMLGGLAMGVIGLLFPQVMGVGYDTMNFALMDNMAGSFMLLLVFVKILATSITLGSGFAGGVFTPSLFLGAMLGGAYGEFVHGHFPLITATSGAYTLVGMGAMASAVLGAPITCILILFELTEDYRIMLPLMLASILASLLIHQIYQHSIYTMALKRKGIQLWSDADKGFVRTITEESIMREEMVSVPDTISLRQLKEKVYLFEDDNFLVHNEKGQLEGMVTFQEYQSEKKPTP